MIRKATESDLLAVVKLLADDQLGSTRENAAAPLALYYREAFAHMERQEGNDLYVTDIDGEVVGCMQLTFIAGVSRKGMVRCQIEGVRVSKTSRSGGIGNKMIQFAIDLARSKGCGLVQLTTDSQRKDAHRFYERFGFNSSHVGMKLSLITN